MKKIAYIVVAFAVIIVGASCSEADQLMFTTTDGVYFKNLAKDDSRDKKVVVREDTLIFSFAYETDVEQYTIKLPVEVMGFTADQDREYKIVIDPKSTAKAGIHYKALKEKFIMPKGIGVDTVEIVVFRHLDLATDVKDLVLNLAVSDDFTLGRKENISVTVRFSDMLEEPEWWEDWSPYMGKYHRIKHQEWMKVAIDFDIYGKESKIPGELWTNPGSNLDIPYELMAINTLKKYFDENPRYTEETYPGEVRGERITVVGY